MKRWTRAAAAGVMGVGAIKEAGAIIGASALAALVAASSG